MPCMEQAVESKLFQGPGLKPIDLYICGTPLKSEIAVVAQHSVKLHFSLHLIIIRFQMSADYIYVHTSISLSILSNLLCLFCVIILTTILTTTHLSPELQSAYVHQALATTTSLFGY